ncbi:MYCBP-associated protein [Pholidichthys leucotaenia]
MAHGHKMSPADMFPPVLDCKGPEGFNFDEQGLILPHSILGSLEDFRCYLEAKGETELVKRIPKSQREPPSEAAVRSHSVEKEKPSDQRNIQRNALQHWDKHMRHRRQQQDFLSNLLDRPVPHLLMNQANDFRETQEWRAILNRAMPRIHSGYGYHVGSEFWSLPQRYGDEMTGISATLTQSEQGRWEPITQIGQPNSIQLESGVIHTETRRPSSRTWDQSDYLGQQFQELREILQDMDIKKPDISGLEVIGSGKPFTFVRKCHSPLLEKKEEENEHNKLKENQDPPAQNDGVPSDALLIPALRFCGHLAKWTGNSSSNQGDVGISATIFFEAPTGEMASSHLELHNEGSTAIFYSWQQLQMPRKLPTLYSQTKNPHFYFDSTAGVIHPGDTRQVEFLFKSAKAGIRTEIWQLNTHPVLLQGASMQVTLKGVALYQDKTADQRLFLETKLEKKVLIKMCQSIVHEVVQGVRTPDRPSSPAELYITEKQEFQSKNTKLQYFEQPVEDLKRLWQEAAQETTWDFSVESLRQVLLDLPYESTHNSLTKEKGLTQLNALLLQLSEPSEPKHHITAAAIGQQLWRKLLDAMSDEALRLRNLLDLAEREMWINNENEPVLSDADVAADTKQDVKHEKKGTAPKNEKSGAKSTFRDDNKGESKSPAAEKSVEENKKWMKRKDEGAKVSKENELHSSASLTDCTSDSTMSCPSFHIHQNPEVTLVYTRLLRKKVYYLLEDLVDNLCDLVDELNENDKQQTQ